jgi:hypothetical protein
MVREWSRIGWAASWALVFSYFIFLIATLGPGESGSGFTVAAGAFTVVELCVAVCVISLYSFSKNQKPAYRYNVHVPKVPGGYRKVVYRNIRVDGNSNGGYT